MEQIIRSLGINPEESFFWGTLADAELDLLIVKNRKRFGFEYKKISLY